MMGDRPGHPFRGNQHGKGGKGGGGGMGVGSIQDPVLRGMVSEALKAGGATEVSKGDYLDKGKVGWGGETVAGVELKPRQNGDGVDVHAKINGADFSLVNTWTDTPDISTQVGFTRGDGLRKAAQVTDRYVEHAAALGKKKVQLASGNPASNARGFDVEDRKFARELQKARTGITFVNDMGDPVSSSVNPTGSWRAIIDVKRYKKKPNRSLAKGYEPI
jgi:hypothetical protein